MVMSPRSIEGYDGYSVDCYGGVRGPLKMLRPNPNGRGYCNVSLVSHVGVRRVKTFTVHSLVAKAFLPDPKAEVNHRDTNKQHNAWHNLEWVTSTENKLHGAALGLYPTGPDHYRFKDGSSDRGRVARRQAIKANYQGTQS